MSRRLALLAAAVLALAPAAARATDVIGNLNVDTRWDLAGSPYRLTGDVTVAPQATLTIEPGVIVEAANADALGAGTSAAKVELIVRGALQANGTAAEPVVFRGVSSAQDAWYGISLEPGARASSITYATIANARYALWGRTTAALTLSDLAVSASQAGLLWQATPGPTLTRVTMDVIGGHGVEVSDDGAAGATATLTDCVISNATGSGLRLNARVTGVVDRSRFIRNQVGLEAAADAALTVTNSVFAGNRAEGLLATQTGANAFDVINNTFDQNEADPFAANSTGNGIHVAAVSSAPAFVIRNNIVTSHGTNGILVDGPTQPSLDHNDVWGNGTNYQGAVAGVGSISANPLYVQAFGGGGSYTFVSNPISLRWPSHNYYQEWIIRQPGAATIRAVVTYLSTESCCDYLRFYDATGAQVDAMSGSGARTTAYAAGDYLRVVFTTDSSVSSTGFDISGYEYTVAGYNYRLQSSSPAIDAGNDLGAPVGDSDATVRPYDGDVNGTASFDLGAYEWHENIAPLAVAGPDLTVLPNTSITFDAVASRDPDGVIASYAWDFGDGSPLDANRSTTHAYGAVGTYTVTLTVTDDQGVAGSDTATITVTNNLPPTANAGPDQFVAPAQAVTLDGGASFDPDGNVVGYAWDFGDGSPAGSGRTVSHTWPANGVYTVTLTVTDDRGATDTDTAAIVVGGGGGGNVAPSADAGLPLTVALGQPASLDGSGSSDADGTIASWSWDFGDGQTGAGETVAHTYAAAGSYVVTLTVTDDDGATDADTTLVTVQAPPNEAPVADAGGPYAASVGQAVAFDGAGSSDPDGSIVAWSWELGDGQTVTGAAPSHTYAAAGTYLVRLTVTDDGGATDDDTVLVTVSAPDNRPPLADAGGNRAADVGASLLFDGTASTDPDGSVVAWSWDFGDGSTGAGAQATHAFAAAGTYLVWLTVTDDDGAIGQDVAVVTVGGAGNRAPVADAGGNLTAAVGANVLLDGSASFDPDGAIVSFAWDLGDGQTGTGAQVSHAYAEQGSYLVRLTVTDDDGDTGEDFVLVTVGGGGGNNVAPIAEAGADVAGDAGEPLVFNAAGSSDPDGQLIAYQWDFGDGATATGLSATHAYQAGGSYVVTLTVIDDGAARATDTLTANVNGLPVANAGPARTGKVGEELAFDAGGSEDADGTIASYAWDFGDGTRAEGQTATHAFAAEGAYTVVLTVTDDAGAKGEATVQVIIAPAADGGDGGDGGSSGGGAAEDGGGCGCSTSSSAGNAANLGWLALGLVGLVVRRGRRTA